MYLFEFYCEYQLDYLNLSTSLIIPNNTNIQDCYFLDNFNINLYKEDEITYYTHALIDGLEVLGLTIFSFSE